MRHPKEALANLKQRLDRVEKKLFDISVITSQTKETSNLFWSQMQSQARKQYEIARVIYSDWTKSNIPFFYNQNIRKQIKKIKG
ncbi:unnamed protein product, partial [marine sediment metagenome]